MSVDRWVDMRIWNDERLLYQPTILAPLRFSGKFAISGLPRYTIALLRCPHFSACGNTIMHTNTNATNASCTLLRCRGSQCIHCKSRGIMLIQDWKCVRVKVHHRALIKFNSDSCFCTGFSMYDFRSNGRRIGIYSTLVYSLSIINNEIACAVQHWLVECWPSSRGKFNPICDCNWL